MMDSVRLLLAPYLKAAWQHRWAALGLAWLVCLGGWFAVYRLPNEYESSARVYIDADAVLTPLLHGLAADTSPDQQIETLQRTLLSRPNMETLIGKTDLDLQVHNSEDRERLITKLQKDIKIIPETRTLFRIQDRDTDPKRAAETVRTLLGIFIERATGSNRQDMVNAQRFLVHQTASYEQALRAAERRRAEFRSKYVDLLPGDNGVSRLESARGQLKALDGQLADARARRTRLQKELNDTPQTIVTETDPGAPGSAGGGGGNGRVAAAQAALAQARMLYTDQHPDVMAAQRALAAARAAPDPGSGGGGGTAARPARSKSVPNPVYEQIKTRLFDTDADLASLERQVTDSTAERNNLEKVAREQPGLQAEYENMDRDYAVLRKNYEELLARRESANIAQAADTTADKVKLQVIDPPQVSRIPVAPNRLLLTSAVLVAGLGAGGALGFLLGQMDRSFRTVSDLRSLGLAVLGSVSLVTPVQRRIRYAPLLSFGIGVALLLVVFGGLLSRMARVAA